VIRETKLRLPDGSDAPVYLLNTVIVGAGAAGMNCAVHLHEFMSAKGIECPEDRIAIVTAGIGLGASRMSGSDKQTYYKMGTSPTVADSAMDFARTLTAFGCCHGDVALCEGENGLREFYHLVQAGVPFPHDPEGAYIGYKTDHDPYERATSAGPKTSKFMSERLQVQTTRYGIPIFDKQEAAHLLKCGERICGLVTVDKNRADEPGLGVTVFLAENIVLAAGGPGELYEISVYPREQTGIHGLALKAGLAAHNLTESQFGLASTKFRWNVSGTYMQVVPRIFSTAADGVSDPQEFLTSFFDSTAKMATNIFLKGYQWPFDSQRILDQQSSIIDVLVHQEVMVKGRRVFMDFVNNPIPGPDMEPFDLENMDEEALVYLQRNGAMQATPIERLEHMNPLAIDIYTENGIDIRTQPLEIAVCSQHHNGGFVVDKWWQSSIGRVFVVGEMAGTHGVKRPGGSALNSGQVGSLRAAEYIANAYGSDVVTGTCGECKSQVAEVFSRLFDMKKADAALSPSEAIKQIQRRMSEAAGHIRQLATAANALDGARALYRSIRETGLKIESKRDVIQAIQAEHLCLAHIAFIEGVVEYLNSGGGSRGSFMVLREDGVEIDSRLTDPATGSPYRFIEENTALRESIAECRLTCAGSASFEFKRVPVRPIPNRDEAFEVAWTAFRTGEVYGK